MINEIEKHELSNEKTFPYFFENIECGKVLSKKIIETISFQNGNFFTILPFNADATRLYEFSQGGIIKSIPYGEKEYKISGFSENFHPQQVITMDRECVTFIASYLQKKTTNCAIIENYMAKPNGVFTSIRGVKTPCHGLENLISFWHFLALLTSIEEKPLHLNSNEVLSKLCDNAEFVIASAYDGEGFIFWERSKN